MKSIKWKMTLVWFFGLCSGAAIALACGILFLRNQLIRTYDVPFAFEQAVQKFPEAASRLPDWKVSHDVCGLPAAPNGARIQNFKLCKQTFAERILTLSSDRKYAVMLPCTISVYENDNGSVKLARWNLPLLSFLLGGEGGSILRDRVDLEQNVLMSIYLQK